MLRAAYPLLGLAERHEQAAVAVAAEVQRVRAFRFALGVAAHRVEVRAAEALS
jgi:hypothetical protein